MGGCAEQGSLYQADVTPHPSTRLPIEQLPQLDLQTQLQSNKKLKVALQNNFQCMFSILVISKTFQTAIRHLFNPVEITLNISLVTEQGFCWLSENFRPKEACWGMLSKKGNIPKSTGNIIAKLSCFLMNPNVSIGSRKFFCSAQKFSKICHLSLLLFQLVRL